MRLHTSDKAEAARLVKEVLSDPSSFDVAVTTYDMALSDALETPLRSKVRRYLMPCRPLSFVPSGALRPWG